MTDWAVIPAYDRERVIAATHREVACVTVTASLEDIRAWARERGLTFDRPGHDHNAGLVDAYIAARYAAVGG